MEGQDKKIVQLRQFKLESLDEGEVSDKLSLSTCSSGSILSRDNSNLTMHAVTNAVESSNVRDDHQTQPIKVAYDANTSENDFSGTDDEKYVPKLSESSDSSSSSDRSISVTEKVNKKSKLSIMICSKKRVRDPDKWKKNIAKKLKNSGKEYISLRTGKVIAAKTMGPTCSEKCRLSCYLKFSTENRTRLFNYYWQLGDYRRQRYFLGSCVKFPNVSNRRRRKSRQNNPRRPNTAFYLYNEQNEIRVCQTFLINTLGISKKTLRTVIDCKNQGCNVIKEDGRGRHGKQKKLDKEVEQSMSDHVNSIPKVERGGKLFIDGDLTIAEMYRNYRKKRQEENKPAANYDAYFRIFNSKYKKGIFVAKEETCDDCEDYKITPVEEEIQQLDHQYILGL